MANCKKRRKIADVFADVGEPLPSGDIS